MNKIARRNERDLTTYLLVAGLIAMVAIVATSVLNSEANLQGAVSYVQKPGQYQSYCTDDDPKDNFHVSGTVQMGNKLYADYCLNEQTLMQQYCSSGRNVKTRRAYQCPNGCLNGACLR